MHEFLSLVTWLQNHSIIVVMTSFVALTLWAYWPSNKAKIEEHGAIPLRDDPLGD
jgi:cbb3-type cytochrome oxidase subunit 3